MEKTAALLYLLLRDHLPAGTVARLTSEAQCPELIEYQPEMGALAYRLADRLTGESDGEEAEKAEGEELPLQPVDAQDDGGFNALDGLDLSDAMVDWLDQFDDRIRKSPDFAAVVNEAAELGRPLSMHTAELVAARVRELGERRRAAGETS